MRVLGLFAVLVLLAGGCSSDDGSTDASGGSTSTGGGAGQAAGGSAGAAGGGGAAGAGGTAGAPSGGGAAGASGGAAGASGGAAGASGGAAGSAALPSLGSLVVLGDSMSDGGGVGPFYYDVLLNDLKAKYGAGLKYQNNAQSGSKTSALEGQVNGLPGTLPGPVAVAITSGGNDMKDQLLTIVAGLDAPARAQMGQNIAKALGILLQPGRFGAGVSVHVFEANIYDASDGQGNYATAKCAFGKGFPALPTDAYFASWNGEIATQVAAKGQWLMDIHDRFRLHGFNHPPSWYASDCTHPNTTGHDQLRRYFYFKITGQNLP